MNNDGNMAIVAEAMAGFQAVGMAFGARAKTPSSGQAEGTTGSEDLRSQEGTDRTSGTARAQTRKDVLLVDVEPIARFGLSQLIDRQDDLRVCAEASSAGEALRLMEHFRPHLAIVDLLLGDASGMDFARRTQMLYPGVAVLVLSMRDETLYAERVLRAGARGYIMKSETMDEVLSAIRQVLAGEVWVSKKVSSKILAGYASQGRRPANSALSALSDREFEIFLLMSSGQDPAEIGAQLHISPKTVDTHRWHIRQKLNLATLPDLTKFALRWGASQEAG